MQSLEIYQIATPARRWDMSPMASNPEKKALAEQRAKALYAKLMALPRPSDVESNNDWTAKAGVSTSFFTNMQGKSKPASEPSIGNLRLALEAVGVTIPEFFADEAKGRLVVRPTKQELVEAIEGALPKLPPQKGKRAEYLADTILRILALPEGLPATRGNPGGPEDDDPEEDAPPRRSTK